MEDWKPAPRTGGRYEISSLGHVRNAKTLHVMRATPDRDGYRILSYRRGSRLVRERVHRLVCEAFNGPPPFEGAVVRHLDGNPGNNLPGNLAWGSLRENEADKRRHGTLAQGERHGMSKLRVEQVLDIRARKAEGARSAELASEYGVDRTLIWQIVTKKVWGHV